MPSVHVHVTGILNIIYTQLKIYIYTEVLQAQLHGLSFDLACD